VNSKCTGKIENSIKQRFAMPQLSDLHEPATPEDLESKALLSPTSSSRSIPNSGNLLKWVALVALVIQNSGLAIVMRYTFLLSSSTHGRYIPSTAVLNAEIVKLIISFSACLLFDCNKSWEKFSQLIYTEMCVNYKDFLKLTIPSMLYTLQNSLQYFSMQCLSAPVFQVLYQMKIITTAIFSVILLSKRLSLIQWSSIVALTLGVGLVQLSQVNSTGNAKGNSLAGLISVILGCVTSGFAGVYFEMVLKSTSASIWLRNIQLSLIGIAMSLVSYC
jgi:UDP-sugar transporter A1/2/3